MKRRIQKTICLLLTAVLLCGMEPLLPLGTAAATNPFATDNYVEKDGFRFYLWDAEADGGEDRGAILISCSGDGPKVTVPATVEGRPVTEIYDRAFSGRENLLSVSLPDSVTRIDNRAFYGCSHLTEILLPAGLKTIGSQAFMGCSHLWNLTLPDSIEAIEAAAFSGCELLTALTIPAGIKAFAFLRDSCVRTITLQEGIEEIPDRAFQECTLDTVYLPDSVKRIGSFAFWATGLRRVEFGSGLETICPHAFEDTILYRAAFPASLKSIGSSAFSGTGLREVILNDGLETIGAHAFEYCSLRAFQIPDSVSNLGSSVLAGNWEEIEQVTLPKSLQTAGRSLFTQSRVKNVVVPDNGEDPIPLSKKMFAQIGDDDVENLWIEGRVDPDALQSAIAGCGVNRLYFRQTPSAPIREAVSAVGYKYLGRADGYDTYLQGAYASDLMQSGSWLFRRLNKQSREAELIGYCGTQEVGGVVAIPETLAAEGTTYSIVSIGENCFSHLGTIRKVAAPASVRTIGDSAFEGCAALEEVSFPGEGLRIGNRAFKSCPHLTTYAGASPGVIGVEAFYGDQSLQTLPSFENTNSIYDNAFENVGQSCTSPLAISFGDQMQMIGYGAFANANITFTFLPESISIDAYAFCGTKVESVAIHGVVPCGCFMNCRSLVRAEISGTKLVECLAFSGCESLREVVADTALRRIEPYAFRDCPALSFVPHDGVLVCDYAFCADSGDTLTLHGTDGCADFRSYECIVDYIDKLVIEEGVVTVRKLEIVHLEELVLPSSLSEFSIDCNFDGCHISTVRCNSETVRSSGLQKPKIDTVIFGENVTSVPAVCAYNASLKKAILLGQVETIQTRAFYGCHALETVECAAPIETVEAAAFDSCEHLDFTSLPIIKTIGSRAFSDCRMRRLELPEGTVSVEKHAFVGCGIEAVVLPASLEKLDNSAFDNNDDLQSIIYNCENLNLTLTNPPIPSNSVFYLSPFYADVRLLQTITLGPSVKALPPFLFCGMQLDTVVIPAGVTDLPEGAFAFSSVREVQCGGTLESIGDYAFFQCLRLSAPPLADGLMLIGKSAFAECVQLHTLMLPDSTVNVGDHAFSNCFGLVSAVVSDQIVFLPNGLFENCGSLAAVEWNCAHKYIGNEAFLNCFSLSVFSFENIAKLYADSFKGSGLTQAVLGETAEGAVSELQEVGDRSFTECASLQMVAVGGQVASIETLAFANCENLETALISDSVERISPDAFANCPKLTIYCSAQSYAYSYAVENGIQVSTFVVAPIPNQRYTGKALEPAVQVSVSGKALSQGSDFTIHYSDNVNAGTATVKVSGVNAYRLFSSTVNFVILTRSIGEATIAPIGDQMDNGSAVTPALRITYNGKTLREGTDYSVAYSNNTAAGKAKATVTGLGNFSGTATAEFNIITNGKSSGRSEAFLRSVLSFFARFFRAIGRLFREG